MTQHQIFPIARLNARPKARHYEVTKVTEAPRDPKTGKELTWPELAKAEGHRPKLPKMETKAGGPPVTHAEVVRVLSEGRQTLAEIAEETGKTYDAVRTIVQVLRKKGVRVQSAREGARVVLWMDAAKEDAA